MMHSRRCPAVALPGIVLLAALCCGVVIASASAATAPPFSIRVNRPQLVQNAIVAVRVSCPANQSRCSGALIVSTLGDPTARVAALRDGLLIAPAQQFSLRRNHSTTLRLLITVPEVRLLRRVRKVVFVAYALGGNPDTNRVGAVLVSGAVKLARQDRRLLGLNRLNLTLVGLRLSKRNALQLTVHCSGASAKARGSKQGPCRGLVEVFAGTNSKVPTSLVALGAEPFVLVRGSTTHSSIVLDARTLKRVTRGAKPFLLTYAIAVDRVDQLSAAALVSSRLARR
jgi:hypothetical protein